MSDKLLTDLFQAYYDARRYKRNTMSALNFEINGIISRTKKWHLQN